MSTSLGGESGSTAKLQPTAQDMPVPGGPVGPSPLFVKDVGDLIKNANQEVRDAVQQYPNWETDTVQAENLVAAIKDIRSRNSFTALRLGVSAFAGVGGAVTTGAAAALIVAGSTTLVVPAVIVIGGATIIGGGIASAIAWWWSAPDTKCSSGGTNKALTLFSDSDVCSFAAGSVGPGNPFPNVFPDPGGTLTISTPGYLPVTITNFQPPADGKQLTIDFPPVPITEDNVGQTITVELTEVQVTQESLTIPVKTETVTYDDPCAFSYPPSLTMVSSGGVAGVDSTTSVHDLHAVDDRSLYDPPMRLYAVAISGDSVKFTFDVSVTPDTSSSVCGNTTYDRTVISASYILDAYDSVDNMRIVETITSANGKFEKTKGYCTDIFFE
ncbi:MAG: hypothetical protein AAB217_03460, partial [Chloroflexota bacterium]